MPLQRTPPQAGGQATPRKNREHTFSPSQAYPDAFAPSSRLAHSPVGATQPQPAPSAQPSQTEQEPQPEDPEKREQSPNSATPIRKDPDPATPTRRTPDSPVLTSSAVKRKQDDLDALEIEGSLVPQAGTAPESSKGAPSRQLPSFDARTPRVRKSMPAQSADTPEQETTKSRLKRARQSMAAGMIPTAIRVEPEPEPEVAPEPEPEPDLEQERALEFEQEAQPEEERAPESQPQQIQPEPQEEATESQALVAPAETHPDPKTPQRQTIRAQTPSRSERARSAALEDPAPPPPIASGDAQYGKYYEALVRTLRMQVVDRGMSRLSLEQMKECFPLLAEAKPEMFENVWVTMLDDLRQKTLTGAMDLLEDYKVPSRMKRFSDLIEDAKRFARDHPGEGRPDAWRADFNPYVLVAGANLELYDTKWEALRDEYRETVDDCVARAERVQAKLAQLEALDNGVSDSVIELAKANALLRDFPTPDMLEWSESVENRLGGRRETE